MTKEEQNEHLKKCREIQAEKKKQEEAKKAEALDVLSSKMDTLISIMTEIRDRLPQRMNTKFLA